MSRDTREIMGDLLASGISPDQVVLIVELTAAVAAGQKQKSSGSERTQRWRDRHKASQGVTELSGQVAVTVTPKASQSVTSDAASLTKEGSLVDSPKKESKKESKSRGVRLSADWKPSPADIEYATGKGMPPARIATEEEKFRDWWLAKPGPDAAKLDWSATWRGWITRSLERQPLARNGPSVGKGDPRGERGTDWW